MKFQLAKRLTIESIPNFPSSPTQQWLAQIIGPRSYPLVMRNVEFIERGWRLPYRSNSKEL
jgi:hypothetical protein